MKREKDRDPAIARNYALSYGKRPEEEFYDCWRDPFQIQNLADDPTYADSMQQLRAELEKYLSATDDPRVMGHSEIFMRYPIWYSRGKRPGESLYLGRDRTGELVLESRIETPQ